MPYTPGWEIVRTPYRPLQVEPQLYLRINLSDTSRFTVKSSPCHYMHGWRTIFGPPVPIFQILSSTWRRLQVDGQFSDPPWCCCSQPGRPMQVDGQLWLCDTNLKTYAGERTIFGPNTKLSKSMETSAGWRTYRFGILPILLNLETFAGWRTIVGKNVKYKLLLAVKHTGAHGLKYMTLGNTKKHGSVQSQALFGAEICMFVWGLWGNLC